MTRNDTELFPTAEAIFRDYYDVIMFLEKRRRDLWIVMISTAIVIVPLAAVFFPLAISLFRDQTPGGFGTVALYYVVMILIFIPVQYEFLDQYYRKIAKMRLMDTIAGSLKMKYRRTGVFPLVEIYDHHILPHYARRTVEEGFSGKYKNFRIEFQDFFIQPVHRYFDGFGYKSVVTFQNYYGLALRIRLNKNFQYHTLLLPAGEIQPLIGTLPNQNLFFHEDVDLIYRDFTRHYSVLSTNQIEARYILDPAVMERFIILAEAFDTDRISASFMDDEMVIVLRPVINLFEVGTLRDPVTVLTIERTLRQIQSLREIADIFELTAFAGLGAAIPQGK